MHQLRRLLDRVQDPSPEEEEEPREIQGLGQVCTHPIPHDFRCAVITDLLKSVTL